jgi:hypothetical protein
MIPKILPTQNENTVDVCRSLTEPVIRIGLLPIMMLVEMQLVKRLVLIIGKKLICRKTQILVESLTH